ncbi:hypothetical protein JTB14_028739 [Gonioctena quinquepunctata]|nr:hypothetical protein JTB14_028739 [Gonioctena quinquepunctata]
MRSEATAAAERKVTFESRQKSMSLCRVAPDDHDQIVLFQGKVVMHDPFTMRPFFGYNFGDYLDHWLLMEKRSDNLPIIFHVSWFRERPERKIHLAGPWKKTLEFWIGS